MNVVKITFSQERLNLVQRLKNKIQKEIDDYIEHYFNCKPKTKFEFINMSFIVTAINNMQKFINQPWSFIEIYERSNYYRLDDIYLEIILEDDFNVVLKYIFMCQDEGNSLIPINDEMFKSFEFIDVFDSLTYKEKE